ncbi:MAG: tetratricopeptide repeat protein [Phycisphaerales bacterium]|nr:MAG: tetratricopeptide repeat protein [Phycisphaerales bacterium]
MLRANLGSIALLSLVAPLPLSAGEKPHPSAGPEIAITHALHAREYERAVELVDAALPAAETADREHFMYYRGLALLHAGRHEDALQQFAEQLEQFPDGPWAPKARFRKADAHVALKQFEAAERIYGDCVRALVGEGRRAEIAKVYLEFAEEYYSPPEALTKPDYQRARGFYERALELEPGEALRDEILYKRALCNHMLEEWATAVSQYEQYLIIFDPDYRALEKQRRQNAPLPAAARQTGKRRLAARLGLAQSRFFMGNMIDARRACQDLLTLLDKAGKDRERSQETTDIWIKATYLLAKTYGIPEPPDAESLALGVQTLEKLLHAHPAAKQAIQAAHDIGAAYAHLGRNDEAITAFRALLERDAIDPNTDETRKLAEQLSQDALFQIGQLYFGQKKYKEAIDEWNQYVARYPAGPLWSAAQQAIVNAEYKIGADAAAEKQYDAAREAWTRFLQEYPLDNRAPGILFAFGSMAYAEQREHEKAGDKPDWNQPIAHWERLVNKFPKTEEAGQAQFEIGRVLEDKIQDLDAAIKAYRKLDWSDWAARAKQRIAEMQATRLLVRTERSFRADEPAKVRVDVRNIDKVSVKLYRIDMQDYFRRSHTVGGVERLDLLLIDPDQTIEVPIDAFATYKPITQEIEIPFEGPGVYAVNVSNETGEKEPPGGGPIQRVEATTLVIRSNIDVIIKSSRRQLLVFAQDMSTQEPAGGVKILVSDGGKMRFEGQTGEDGVWLSKSKDLKDLGQLSVLALRDEHVAGNALSLQGLEFSTGLQARGYINTDRPVYRPGEAVNICGILREVKDGQYCLPTQPEDERLGWKLDVVDAKGRVLRTEPVSLSDFGSFATQFRVADDGPTGEYKLIVRRPEGPTFTGRFNVQVYEVPKALLRFEFDEPVVMRGDKIKGSLVATYTYGEPVVGKTVEYNMQLWTGEPLNRVGVTDEEGKVAFEFDSTLFPEEGGVLLQARQADLEIATSGTVFIAVRAFRATVKTVRREAVFLAEEPVEVTVETKNLKGEPIAKDMTLTALLRTHSWTETKVASAEVHTDEKTGVGRVTLRLDKGGTYVLRAEGKDRFGHVVLAEAQILVSDDEDRTRLRLFSDRQHYKVGETIDLSMHSRLGEQERQGDQEPRASAGSRGTAPAFLALVTYEGDEIIGYRTVRIAPGHNPLQIPVENAHFPNFAVGVAVMEPGATDVSHATRRGRLHSATREFTVERQLTITLKPDKETYHPREELTLDVTVTDQQGNPVEAEVGLAMIDNALLSRYPDPTPHIVSFFQEGAHRRAALRTETSCTFRYNARTRAMVTELLAEARREAEEAARYALAPAAVGGTPDASVSYSIPFRVYPLSHRDAGEMRDVLERLFSGSRRKEGSASSDRIAPRIEVDSRSNSLLVSGDPRLLEQIAVIARQLDSPASWTASSDTALRDLQVERGPMMAALAPEFLLEEGAGHAWSFTRGGDFSYAAQFLPSDDLMRQGLGGSARGMVFRAGRPAQQAQQQLAQSALQLGETYDFEQYGRLSYGYSVPGAERYAGRRGVQRALRDKTAQVRAKLANVAPRDIPAIGAELNTFVREAPPRTYFPEVAYWNPRITTDADGKATVKIIVPDSSTKWKFIARGATPETLVGRGEAQVLSKHDFFVELITPSTLIEGDKFQPRATVHCLTPYEGKVDVTLRASRRGDAQSEGEAQPADYQPQTRTIDVKGTGTFDVTFDALTVGEPGEIVFDLSAQTQEQVSETDKRKLGDVTVCDVPIRPWGMAIEAHAAGVGQDTDFVEIELPPVTDPQREYHDVQLTVAVGPSMQRWLIEEALESGPRWHYIEHQLAASRIAPPRTHADTASSLLACLHAADYVRSQDTPSSADVRVLDERVAGLIAQLLATQDENGGWTWCGKGREADPWTSACVAWALGKARHNGHPVADQAVQKLVNYLRKVFADANPSQYELKATVLHGLSWFDTVDFAHVNRLHRSRENLSNAALGHLALTFVRLDRNSAAGEVLAVLQRRVSEGRGPRRVCWLSNKGNSAWMNSELEVTALALLAQISVDARVTTVPKMVAYLTAAARADGWRPHKARGTVLAALATYYARAEQQAANYTLAVSINGEEVRKLTSDDTGSLRIDVGQDELRPGKQRVDFAFSGRGEYAYAITLRGFSRGFPDTNEMPRNVLRVYERAVMPPAIEYRGRVVPAGFSVAQEYDWFRNKARHLPVGEVASVEVSLRRYNRSENTAGDRDYVIVKETIPAGFRLLEETVSGEFLASDYTDNVLTLYYGSRRDLGGLNYRMVATTPGDYPLPPTIIRSLYRPEVVHVNKADELLTVLSRGSKNPDDYRMTPDELYNLGKLHFDDEVYAPAAEHLEALLAGKWLLRDEPYRESVRMLLSAALDRDDPDAIVNYFEILKEKYPDLVVPFEQIIRVAAAYSRTGQYERAYLVYRATADASFVRDSAVGGTLQDEGRFLESIDFLENLWRAYPDTPQVESTYYALAQTLAAQAQNPSAVRPRRAADGGKKYVTREDILREAIALLEKFLALYPESPVADEASYSLAAAYLELDEFTIVIRRTQGFVERFVKSKWLDRFRYIQALALFHRGEFEQARALAQLVSEATYRDDQGVERPSPNKWLALYIIGQIFHAQGKTADAIAFYDKVRDRFSDADEAVSYFEHKYVELPEVTIFHPDEDGFREADEWSRHLRNDKPEHKPPPSPTASPLHDNPFIRIDYRNVKSAVLQVYRVDLLKLALIGKNLTQITAVNLAGIKPIVERTVTLGDGHDYVDKSFRVMLDGLSAEEGVRPDDPASAVGAYLIMCRSDDLFSSGLVLVTPLAVEVQEDVPARRTRVNVVNAITRSGLSDVHLKVIGTEMKSFVSGETDLRGVFVADGVSGYPTAVARDAAGHFAFYRSDGATLAMAALSQPSAAEKELTDKDRKTDYRLNVSQEQRRIQGANAVQLEGMFKKGQKGVKIKSSQ